MKYDSEFSHKYAANLKSITEQAARLFSSAFGIDDLEIAEQFAAIFMATLDGFAIQQILHTIPEDDTSYTDTMLDFFKTCVYSPKNKNLLEHYSFRAKLQSCF